MPPINPEDRNKCLEKVLRELLKRNREREIEKQRKRKKEETGRKRNIEGERQRGSS